MISIQQDGGDVVNTKLLKRSDGTLGIHDKYFLALIFNFIQFKRPIRIRLSQLVCHQHLVSETMQSSSIVLVGIQVFTTHVSLQISKQFLSGWEIKPVNISHLFICDSNDLFWGKWSLILFQRLSRDEKLQSLDHGGGLTCPWSTLYHQGHAVIEVRTLGFILS